MNTDIMSKYNLLLNKEVKLHAAALEADNLIMNILGQSNSTYWEIHHTFDELYDRVFEAQEIAFDSVMNDSDYGQDTYCRALYDYQSFIKKMLEGLHESVNTDSSINNDTLNDYQESLDLETSFNFDELQICEKINCPECGYFGVTRMTENCPMCGAPIGSFFRRWNL